MLDEDAGPEQVVGGKTEDPRWDRPEGGGTDVHFILHQNQVWVNRQSLLQWLEVEIGRVKQNHIQGINNHWDHSKVEYLRWVQGLLRGLQPREPEEGEG